MNVERIMNRFFDTFKINSSSKCIRDIAKNVPLKINNGKVKERNKTFNLI